MSYSDSYEDSGYYDFIYDDNWDALQQDREDEEDRRYQAEEDQRAWDLLDEAYECEQLEALEEAIEPDMPGHSGASNQRLIDISIGVPGWTQGIIYSSRWWMRGHRKGFKSNTLRSHRPHQHGWYRRKGDDLIPNMSLVELGYA